MTSIPWSSRGHTQTLANLLALGPMPLAAALRCATEIGAALREIHELLELHRPEWYTREVRNLMKSGLRQWQWPEI